MSRTTKLADSVSMKDDRDHALENTVRNKLDTTM